ncbi:transcription factor SRM1-like [Impatiens glandulifera]|uniref:transcription factor SRM1-like n=1 Tax=Impatiens glandulifera TaxID=253017 RepID=UPI001FB15D39|nr:transcription factor SRM1-like [Impatiens glandulifera]XP_047319732.1 transcription factor SRM1-like [Impatiens glandulifera]
MPADKMESNNVSTWSRDQEKAFENALATHPEDSDDWFEKIAADVPGKSLQEVKHHYELLLDDLSRIESGLVPLPNYNSSSDSSTNHSGDSGMSKKDSPTDQGSKQLSKTEQERRKGIAWTEDEHRLFLIGLEKYGKGDWRSISRNFVVTRTPTQVASHAQKYFIRLNSSNSSNVDRRRLSIHDITSVNNNGEEVSVVPHQGPITGQTSSPTPVSLTAKMSPNVSSLHGMYGTTAIGQPVVGGPFVSAIGTPVNIGPSYGMPIPYPILHNRSN